MMHSRDVGSTKRLANGRDTMTKILTSYTGDYAGKVEHAQRTDGQWFKRARYQDPRYGYKWQAWSEVAAPYSASGHFGETMARIRLPKAA